MSFNDEVEVVVLLEMRGILYNSGSVLKCSIGATAAAPIAGAVLMMGVTMVDMEAGLDGTRHCRRPIILRTVHGYFWRARQRSDAIRVMWPDR